MIIIPQYILFFIPLLTFWIAYACIKRQKTNFLILTTVMICVPLYILSHFEQMIPTWYGGPLAARGIFTFQIPLSIMVTMLLPLIITKEKTTRIITNVLAISIGEILLTNTWIS